MTDAPTTPQTEKDAIARWLKEIKACQTREQDYRKEGQRILELYDGTKASETPFNILYSNTETLLPALYSATPRPVVDRRFKDDDPLGKSAAQAGKRGLEFLIDTDLATYETFDDGMSMATLTALLPGRAVTCVKYDGNEDDDYQSETVCLQSKQWNRVYFGYAHTWTDVPWVAYEDYIDKPEAQRLKIPDELIAQMQFTDQENREASDETKGEKQEPHQGETKLACIYQIWSKADKMVYTLSEQVPDQYLKAEEDPLGLPGFFNCPKPLTFLKKPHSLTPTALYTLYESQAKELNELTRRIKAITKAIRAKYLYDSALGADLQKLVDATENEMVPADSSSALAAEKGLQNAIWAYPNESQIIVLRELYTAREQCKQVIYEITGISDILRGASKASETLGAQKIKEQWGGLRVKRAQKEVARYACDLLAMMLDVAASKFSQETWAKMTGLPFLVDAKYNELTKIAELLTQQVQQMQALLPPTAPGAPPPMPPPQVQQLQQVKAQLQAPRWADVLKLLQNDLLRAYRIDIETNSTVEPEAAEDQKQINEVLTALSQVLQGMGPLVINGSLPFEAAQTMLLTIIRRFRFGPELEDTIKAMQPPKPPDDGSAKVAQMQAQMAAKDAQAQQQAAQHDLQQKSMAAEQAAMQKQADLQLREIQLKMEETMLAQAKQAFEKEVAMRDQLHQAKLSPEAHAQEMSRLQAERATEVAKAKIQQETDLKKAAMDQATKIEVAKIAAKAQAEKAEKEPVEA